jgi:hypothetical protein
VPCLRCLKRVTFELGINCVNYGSHRGNFPACNEAWHASCFTVHPLDQFEVRMPWVFNGVSLAELEDEIHFKQARPGDHLCVPFHCPNCQSRNLQGKSIDPSHVDNLVLECMTIRVTLDTFWSWATKTISNHIREVRNMAQYGQILRYLHMPVLRPWDLHSHLGMDEAIMVLIRYMEKGKTGATVLYDTARKSHAILTVLWKSSPLLGDDLTLSAGSIKGRFVATLCLSEGQCYQYSKTGICTQMGDVVS